ncbi:MAG: lysophospholipid acyltransferase family protein [Prolixibacteraceae bacterium]|nr:lysophospholipid acyltransferase family protein [Prolixibacteraceae bacterium]
MNSRFLTNSGIFFLKVMSRFPFTVIYFLSDIFYFVLYHLVGYRKKVVLTNLRNSFSEKPEKEIRRIARHFFRHLADLFLETIKMRGMQPGDFKKRVVIKNAKMLNRYFEQGKSIVVLTMHYNNWEWSCYLPEKLKHTFLGVYKPLHNLAFDNYMVENRGALGVEMVQNAHVLRRILKAEKSHEPVLTWLAGDQTPPEYHKGWYLFLHQETMFYPGTAAISRRFNHPVFFQKMVKTGRGKYEISFELLFENPAEVSEAEIIKTYIRKMEETIAENPAFYLWSHKRWKHKRPEKLPLSN